jgi:hypothetical protein
MRSPGPGIHPSRVVRLALVGLIAAVAAFNVWRTPPRYNWDLLPYIAIAKSYDIASPKELHRATYDLAEQRVPAERYRAMVLTEPYRVALARDSDLFAQVLPFYRVKPLYPFVLHLLDRAGIDPVLGGTWLSWLAYFAIAVLLGWWCGRHLPPLVTALCVPLVVSSGAVTGLSGWFSPDALSTLVMLAATILIVEGHAKAGWPTMAFAVVVRPDNLIFLGLFGLWALWRRLPNRAWIVATMAAGCVLQLLENRAAANYGWKLLFHNAMVQRVFRPAEFQPVLDFAGYVDVYVGALRPGVISEMLMPAMALAIAGAVLHRRWSGPDAPWTGILTIAPIYMVIHWLVHPVDKDRTLVFGYLIVLCGMLFLTASRPRAIDAQD